MKQKEEMRESARKSRNALTDDQRRAMSIDIARQVSGLEWFKESQQLLLYLSIRSEVETQPLMELAWAAGKQLYAPQVDERNKHMVFYRVEAGEIMKPGAYGIPAPPPVSSRKADMGRPGMVLVPCLAFDRQGGRLGYGAGFYDRFLSSGARGWKKVALAYGSQEVEAVPTESHDTPMQAIVTEKEIIKVKDGSRSSVS